MPQARDGMLLTSGEVVVAHPDAHLLVVDGRVVFGRGPRENGARPSHDAMLGSPPSGGGRARSPQC